MNDPAANFDPRRDTREDAPEAPRCACCDRAGLELRGGACGACWTMCTHEDAPCSAVAW